MDIKKTITSIFIVPTLKINRDQLRENGFLNGYISDERRDVQYKDAVYLLFKPDDLDKFRSFLEEEMSKNQEIIDDYDYEDGYVVIACKLDSKWKKDYMLVREGLYSRTSKKFQALFPQIIKADKSKGRPRDQLSLQFRVFSKSSELITFWEDKIGIKFTDEMEVWEGFHVENETLNLEKIKTEELV
jgi:hypothetical protein